MSTMVQTPPTAPDGPTIEPPPVGCVCHKCTRPVYDTDDQGRRYVVNNLHGRLQPCETCGRLKTEYVDRYTHGYYECWWCTERAAGNGHEGDQ